MFRHPTFYVDETISRANISRMAGKARASGLQFRPHFKTHQSLQIGEWFRDEGVKTITVSSVSMARFFQKAGWDDITIAFPLNVSELDELNQLAAQLNLNVLIDMPEQAAAAAKSFQLPSGFFIEIDDGYHRSGIEPGETGKIDQILRLTRNCNLKFRGFLTHSGQTYTAGNKAEVLTIFETTKKLMSQLKQQFISFFPGIIASVGDTPSCSVAENFLGIDEIRPGNFVFYDLMQLNIGSCTFGDIASAVICPVVSVYPHRGQGLIYGGAVHLSKESLILADAGKVFGLIVPFNGNKWLMPEGNDYLTSLSQEHGIFNTSSPWAKSLKPGDLVAVIPVHSCLAADLAIRQ